MRILRPVVIGLTAFLVCLVSGAAMAVHHQLNSSFSFGQTQPSSVAPRATESYSGSLGYRVQNLGSHRTLWGFGITAQTASLDPQMIQVRNRQGQMRSLEQELPSASTIESSISPSFHIAHRSYRGGITASHWVGRSTYGSRAVIADHHLGIFEDAVQMGFHQNYGQTRQPESWYINESLQLQPRPTRVIRIEHGLSVAYPMTEFWKMTPRIDYLVRNPDRPVAWRASLDQNFALSDRWIVQLGAERMQESQRENLKDDRGYFTTDRYAAGLMWEPVYDWTTKVTAGLVLERELEPRLGNRITQRAINVLTWENTLLVGDWQPSLSGSILRTNQRETGYQVAGGTIWNF